jgi:hypothetical protein
MLRQKYSHAQVGETVDGAALDFRIELDYAHDVINCAFPSARKCPELRWRLSGGSQTGFA